MVRDKGLLQLVQSVYLVLEALTCGGSVEGRPHKRLHENAEPTLTPDGIMEIWEGLCNFVTMFP